jgi:hypothetical protein
MKHRTDALKKIILLLQGLGLLVALLASFVGGLYMFNGNILYAMPISLVLVVAMFYLVSYFMKEKANRKKKGYSTMFYYLLVLYAVLGSVVSFFVLHFVNVELNEKEEIRALSAKKLKGIEAIYAEYNQQYMEFCDLMRTDIILKTSTSNLIQANRGILNGAPYNLDDNMLNVIESRSSKVDAINQMKIQPMMNDFAEAETKLLSNKSDFFESCNNAIEGWSRMKIARVFNELDQRITADYDVLNQKLQSVSTGQAQLITDQKPYLEDAMMDKPLQLAVKHLGLLAFVVLVIFQLLILLPYFLTKGRQY